MQEKKTLAEEYQEPARKNKSKNHILVLMPSPGQPKPVEEDVPFTRDFESPRTGIGKRTRLT